MAHALAGAFAVLAATSGVRRERRERRARDAAATEVLALAISVEDAAADARGDARGVADGLEDGLEDADVRFVDAGASAGEDGTAAVTGGGRDGEGAADATAPTCRFCFEESGDLVSPCACSGTSAHVHVGCLRRWQQISLQTHGSDESACRVCGEAFSLPKPPALQRLAMWFSPSADDRAAQYGRVWMQMMINTAFPGDDMESLARPGQLARLVAAAETRIWAKREIRRGNALFRVLSRLASACEWTHGICVLLYAATGMSGVGLEIISHAALALATEQAPGAPALPIRATLLGVSRPVSHALLGLCNGPLGALVHLTAPLHRLVHFFTLYPSYSFPGGTPEEHDGERRRRPRLRLDFGVAARRGHGF